MAQLSEVIAPPSPNATIGLYGSDVLTATAQSSNAYSIHCHGVGGLGALRKVTEPQLPIPAAASRSKKTRKRASSRLLSPQENICALSVAATVNAEPQETSRIFKPYMRRMLQ